MACENLRDFFGGSALNLRLKTCNSSVSELILHCST
jgi:hypothetical protein